jgi:hypothetical protein
VKAKISGRSPKFKKVSQKYMYLPLNSISTPIFLEDENIFQKSASMVPILLHCPMEPRRPIFEKCSHLREKCDPDQILV